MQSNNKKICILVSSLGKGGAERSTGQLSIMLHELGYDVHVVIILNHVDFEYRGTLLNLGDLKDKDDTLSGKWSRYLMLKRFIKAHNFDWIIDNRSRVNVFKEVFFQKFILKSERKIFVVRSFKLDVYFPKPRWFINVLFSKNAQIVAVSSGIKTEIERVFNFKHIDVIYNPIAENTFLPSIHETQSYILFYGRLDDGVKNISLLLEAYKLSELSNNHIHLMIMGEGKDKAYLKKKVLDLGLDGYVIFKTFVSNPLPIVAQAKYVCLTSRLEGFPRVLLESLSVGVPVVSVDCKSGPNEIIIDGFNGLLVENFNAKAISYAMNRFIFDKPLYETCKKNAKRSVEKFSIKKITNDWKQLLEKM
ncbi:glycosyltransferase [Formosa sediminum]|uniref:glycosyltransferase n=1 Tax=Formosa sediminum TaxID=2594004 RepID=UPI00163DDC2D|nr:glycosyltransferase [Formosa sediminum]